nr:hypothetical protein [Pseudopedobacter sp.]
MQQSGLKWMLDLRKKWLAFSYLNLFFVAVALGLIVAATLTILFQKSYLIGFIIGFLPVLALLFFYSKSIKIQLMDLAVFINQRFPEVEDSTQLVLQAPENLNFLQRLQVEKLNHIIPQLNQPKEPLKKLRIGFIILVCGLIASFAIQKLPIVQQHQTEDEQAVKQISSIKDVIPPEIKSVDVEIIAPAYTQLSTVHQKQFSIKVVAGTRVSWLVNTNKSAKAIKFIFNEKEVISLKPKNDEHTEWNTAKVITRSGFYQVETDGRKSDLYLIEVIEDQLVSIKIIKPEQQTVIDFGQPQKVSLNVLLSDDFGISSAEINATIASGKGESVSFKQIKLSFNQTVSGKEANLSKVFNLKALGMNAGDELYFFVKAKDNHGQESRSDIYIVSIADTTALMSMNGMLGGVNLVPEYFRSQRQIIMDTENLLKEQSSISADEFKSRSNNLGIDQKLLRLRYGKFLGEESETNIGEAPDEEAHHDDDHDQGKQKEEQKFGDATAIMDEYSHKHDNAEDATFFEPEQKAKLKATLTEMWNSELRLRTYKPTEALPYEYKALRLLKDLQQSSRAYVAKTTIKTTPLKLEKRLTGELDKIVEPVSNQQRKKSDIKNKILKAAIAVLEESKQGNVLAFAEQKTLSNSRVYVVQAATQNPSIYLKSLQLLNSLTEGNTLSKSQLSSIQHVVQLLITDDDKLPQAGNTNSGSSLGKAYFQNLKSKQ